MTTVPKIFSDPALFGQLVSFFVVPLGILALSWLIQRHLGARLNSGIEFFSFLAALDFTFLAQTGSGATRINPIFGEHYYPLFVSLVILSLVSMAYAAKVQSLIYEHLSSKMQNVNEGAATIYYPIVRVGFCWVIALAGIGFHLFVALGDGSCLKHS